MSEIDSDIQAVRDYLGIEDDNDDLINRNITRQLAAADRFLQGAIHTAYDRSDPRAKELTVMIAAELYDNRGVMSRRSGEAFRRLAHEFAQQIRLEMQEGEQ